MHGGRDEMIALHARRFRRLLLGAAFSALVVTAPGAANHGPADAVNALHTNAVNNVPGTTIVNGLVAGGLFAVHNTNTVASSGAIIGEGDAAGWGVEGSSTSGNGVAGISQSGNGVFADATGANAIGL